LLDGTGFRPAEVIPETQRFFVNVEKPPISARDAQKLIRFSAHALRAQNSYVIADLRLSPTTEEETPLRAAA
jgi:hypothetical protein